jgi:hypothetical protein
VRLHQNAQRLLKPLRVLNPFAQELSFPTRSTRLRRDHDKYLGLIRTVTLLHQYQRPIRRDHRFGKTAEAIEVTLEDIEVATKLAKVALSRSLDEVPPQTRRFWQLIDAMVDKRCREQDIERSACFFSRRDLREHTGWSQTQVRFHLQRLVELEYVGLHRAASGHRFMYELLADAKQAQCPLRLVDVAALRAKLGVRCKGGGPNTPGGGQVAGGCYTAPATPNGAQTKNNHSGWRPDAEVTSGETFQNGRTIREVPLSHAAQALGEVR